MKKLTHADLHTLEGYAARREKFRARMLEHKRDRRLALGEHVALYFEDRLTMHYQVQEMLRVERIFERDQIQAELDAYNPLIPDGSNWKATFMIEYADPKERAAALAELVGIENRVWLQVQGEERVWAIADEDLERATPEKTSSVHFLRFELTPAMAAAVIEGADVDAGVDHANYRHLVSPIGPDIRASLAGDLD